MKIKYFLILFGTSLLISCNNGKDKVEENPTTNSLKQRYGYVPECDELLKLFHTVGIDKGHSIQLKKDISSLDGLTNKLTKNFYSLKKGSFRVADSMAVEVNNENKIIAITAAYNYEPEYSNDTIYIHELRKFRKLLCNQGKETIYSGKDTAFKVTKWETGNIIFELVDAIVKNKKQTYSVIFDKELYTEKLKPIDISNKDLSIELENRKGWAGFK